MNKSIWLVAAALSLTAAPHARVCSQDYDYGYSDVLSYHPFRVQIEGGRTITQGSQDRDLDNGMNLGLGFTWQPTSTLPLALRVDGMYEHFEVRPPLLAQAETYFGTRIDEASAKMWGGDVDAELDFTLGTEARVYLLGGAGGYDEQDSYRQLNPATGATCGGLSCASTPASSSTLIGRRTSGMRFEENAGVGMEFAIGERGTFFVDARYMRFSPSRKRRDFIPIRFGVRY